ncbi:MAG: hypothetical protein O7G85_09810 [Planctomycetota bacterium]|nr:hypothetical protein [Planctomycetota bacterium]
MLDPISLAALATITSPTAAMVYCMPSMQTQDATEAVEEITEKHRDAERAFFNGKYQEAETDEERQELLENDRPKLKPYVTELHEIAKKHPGSEAAATAASWVLGLKNRGYDIESEGDWALAMLMTDHLDSDAIVDVPRLCSGMSSANVATLEKIRTESKNERARALADYYRAGQLIMLGKAAQSIADSDGPNDPYLSYNMDGIDDELKASLSEPGAAENFAMQGVNLYEHCLESYTEIALYDKIMVSTKAESSLFAMRNLQIGDVAPNVTGVDAEGVEFNLYDYRGQVVVLDFWGFW